MLWHTLSDGLHAGADDEENLVIARNIAVLLEAVVESVQNQVRTQEQLTSSLKEIANHREKKAKPKAEPGAAKE